MAVEVVSVGAALVKVGTGSAGALENLGYTRNGSEIEFHSFMLDVPGDENGGDDGPPIEIQDLGQLARIRLEFTKFDYAILKKIRARQRGGTDGTPGTPGTLMFAGGKDYRLLIHTTSEPYNFTRCIFREPFVLNPGTKFQIARLEGTAYKDANGVLFNNVTS